MTYKFAFEKRDYARIDKLTNAETFYDEARKLVKNVKVVMKWKVRISLLVATI